MQRHCPAFNRVLFLVLILLPAHGINAGLLPGATSVSYRSTGKNINESWTAAENAVGYELLYAPSLNPSEIESVDMGSRLSFKIKLPAGTALYFAVRAYNALGFGPVSEINQL